MGGSDSGRIQRSGLKRPHLFLLALLITCLPPLGVKLALVNPLVPGGGWEMEQNCLRSAPQAKPYLDHWTPATLQTCESRHDLPHSKQLTIQSTNKNHMEWESWNESMILSAAECHFLGLTPGDSCLSPRTRGLWTNAANTTPRGVSLINHNKDWGPANSRGFSPCCRT